MKRLFWGLTIVLVTILSVITVVTATGSASNQVVNAKAALIADASTGQIIYAQNANQRLPIASVSKLLTACVIEDEISHHQLKWNDKVTINKQLAAISNDKSYSAVGLQQGEPYTVQELFNAMLIKSADGAALALATAHGQTMAEFNHKMRVKAHQIGLTNYLIVNPVGLDNEDVKSFQLAQFGKRAQNAMTARDVARLSQYLLVHYPHIVQTTSQTKFQITIKGKQKTYNNMNKMLAGQPMAMADIPIDGLKTGTSNEAGACFASSGQYQGHRIVTVVLNANGGGDARFKATQQLYRYLQGHYRLQNLQMKSEDQRVRVYNGRQRYAKVTIAPLQVWTNKHSINYRSTRHLQASLAKKKGVKAPLKKGQQVGTVRFSSPSLKYLDANYLSTPLYAKQADPVGNFWQRLIN